MSWKPIVPQREPGSVLSAFAKRLGVRIGPRLNDKLKGSNSRLQQNGIQTGLLAGVSKDQLYSLRRAFTRGKTPW